MLSFAERPQAKFTCPTFLSSYQQTYRRKKYNSTKSGVLRPEGNAAISIPKKSDCKCFESWPEGPDPKFRTTRHGKNRQAELGCR
jgi:hypothetical protein